MKGWFPIPNPGECIFNIHSGGWVTKRFPFIPLPLMASSRAKDWDGDIMHARVRFLFPSPLSLWLLVLTQNLGNGVLLTTVQVATDKIRLPISPSKF